MACLAFPYVLKPFLKRKILGENILYMKYEQWFSKKKNLKMILVQEKYSENLS